MDNKKNPKERINELISKGYTKIQTIRAMRNEGYKPEDVDAAMEEFLNESKKESEYIKPKPVSESIHENFISNNIMKEIETLRKQVEENRSKIESISSKDLKNYKKLKEHEVEDIVNFQSRLEKMHEDMKEDFEKAKEQMEEFQAKMKAFEKDIEEIKKIEDDIKKLDLKQIRREIEILKTKEQWIEHTFENIDIRPVVEKMEEIEHKIDRLKATSPFVIE